MQAERATLPDTATAATTAEVTLAAARLHWIHDEQPQCIKALRKAFDLADQAAVAAITGMSMVDRQITIFSTASHVALRAGNTKEAQAYSELVTSLQQAADQKTSSNHKARLWHEANSLSRMLRSTTKDHQTELDTLRWPRPRARARARARGSRHRSGYCGATKASSK
jgi:hypothetical protein